MNTQQYFETKTRDNNTVETFYTVKEGNQALLDIIRELHFDNFPTDKVYEIAYQAMSSLEESHCETYEDSFSIESPYPIYTNEINREYFELSNVIENAWDDIKDYFYHSDDLTPHEYNKAVLYAYYDYVTGIIREFMNDVGFWNDKEE